MSKDEDPLVLVTGATGFIAHHVIQLLQREGYRVRGTMRSLKQEDKLKSLRSLCSDARYPLELVEVDLTKDNGWNKAIKDCTYCIHVASPCPNAIPDNEGDLIIPAVEGTKRVLKICASSASIKRVVLTSSISAVHGETVSDEHRVYTEEDWTDVSSPYTEPYPKSKTMAEQAAWDFMSSLPPDRKLELAVVNPSTVFGPCINGAVCTSLELVKRLMDYSVPLVPRVHLSICDVRDVALAHLRAMTYPEAAYKRHIIHSEELWMQDMAQILRKEFSQYGYFVPSLQAPYIFIYLFKFIDSLSSLALTRHGVMYKFSNLRMKEVLKIQPRSAEDILIDTAYSLIECGILPKTSLYEARK